jgi:hypothetical protein
MCSTKVKEITYGMTVLILFWSGVVWAYWCIFLHHPLVTVRACCEIIFFFDHWYHSWYVSPSSLANSQVCEHGFQTLILCVALLFCHYMEQLIIFCLYSSELWILPFMICWLCRDMLLQGSYLAVSTSHFGFISYDLGQVHKKESILVSRWFFLLHIKVMVC